MSEENKEEEEKEKREEGLGEIKEGEKAVKRKGVVSEKNTGRKKK